MNRLITKSIQLDGNEWSLISRIAKKKNKSLSSTIRKILKKKLKKRNKK